MIDLNKWCPLAEDKGWSKCIKENCVFWDNAVKDCDFRVVAEYLKATEKCSREGMAKCCKFDRCMIKVGDIKN